RQPGAAAFSPSSSVIPAGLLSSDIVFQGLNPVLDGQPVVVTPTSGGYAGKFSYVYVASNVLQLALPYPYTVDVGQTFQPYVQFTYAMDHALIVSTRLSPSLGTTPDTVTIPTGSTYRFFTA